MKKIIIAIDGESSSGKTSLAKKLANKIGYKHINTGSMYRAVTFVALQNNLIFDSSTGFDTKSIIKLVNKLTFDFKIVNNISNIFLNGVNIEDNIRSTMVSDFVSQISTIKEVREKIVSIQRDLGVKKGVVMEGRDIGSVVFPNAELKFYVTADLEVRVRRRFNELIEKGINIKKSLVYENLKKRDYLDKNRDFSPLFQCEDAVLIDNTNLTIDDQILIIKNHIQKIT